MKTILFTGGGSAGHVTPNLALIDFFQKKGWNCCYVGSKEGIEQKLIQKLQIPYYSITTDKMRRHLTWKNFVSPFKVMWGVLQAFYICHKLKPHVVFSKGGFVAFPVVFAAWLNKIPVVTHESDLTPGLANRLSFPFAKQICLTFAEGEKFFSKPNKINITGTPIRSELLTGDLERGLNFCGFNKEKPVLLIFGGGLGSDVINKAIRNSLSKLLERFQVVHLCGHGKTDSAFNDILGYKQFAYLNEELADVFACAEFVVSRAGANSIYELLVLKKPHLLIPLSTKASRGDQIQNANYFLRKQWSFVLSENELSEKLLPTIFQLNQEKDQIKQRLMDVSLPNSVEKIYQVVLAAQEN